MLLILSELMTACAVRLEPAYITGLTFAKQSAPPPVIAVPLSPRTIPTLETRTTGLEMQTGFGTQAEYDLPSGLGAYAERDIPSELGADAELDLQFRLYSVFFETDKANLRPEGMQQVNEFAEIIQQYEPSTVFIEGHADNQGGEVYNQALSERRANTVRNVLITKGVEPERLVIKSFGENEPIATNATSQGRQQNRRVELIIPNETKTY